MSRWSTAFSLIRENAKRTFLLGNTHLPATFSSVAKRALQFERSHLYGDLKRTWSFLLVPPKGTSKILWTMPWSQKWRLIFSTLLRWDPSLVNLDQSLFFAFQVPRVSLVRTYSSNPRSHLEFWCAPHFPQPNSDFQECDPYNLCRGIAFSYIRSDGASVRATPILGEVKDQYRGSMLDEDKI